MRLIIYPLQHRHMKEGQASHSVIIPIRTGAYPNMLVSDQLTCLGRSNLRERQGNTYLFYRFEGYLPLRMVSLIDMKK